MGAMSGAWPDDKRNVLREITFGSRVAEEEASELSGYFVETDQWHRLYRGDIDVVYGAKGSGKSAMFALLLSREDELFDRQVLLAGVEDARGAPVFSQLVDDPPTTESEFRALWKLYFLSLIGRQLREYRISGPLATRVVDELERTGLLEESSNLRKLLNAVRRYVRLVTRASLQAQLELDPVTGAPGVSGRITFREPSLEERQRHGLLSVDEALEVADEALREAGLSIWLVLDRLDVTFAESERLESNALRALFRVYLGFRRLDRISLKIFLRSDIWERITEHGFREASHITRELTIAWNPESLMHLIIRRLLGNSVVRARFGIDEASIVQEQYQRHVFYAIFPKRFGRRAQTEDTFEWILSLVSDGSGAVEPRELIHLFNATRDAQIRRLETGHPPPEGDLLFDLVAFGEALSEVSQARLRQSVYAEHPQCKPWIERLVGERIEHTMRSLATLWSVNEREAGRRVERLVTVGVLEPCGARTAPLYRLPVIYRPALGLLSGTNWVFQRDAPADLA
jgi:hypothetical protein